MKPSARACRWPTLYMASLAALASLLLGCSPLVNLPGKQVTAPRLDRSHFVAVDRAVLPVRAWLPASAPPRATIVALHGFNDYSNFFDAPGRFLSQQGVACYAYDQRGFGNAPGRGLWSGTDAYIRDLGAFTAEVRRRHPGIPLFVLGESMGGAVAIVAMTGANPPQADGLILVAPAVWARETQPWYQRWLLSAAVRTLPWWRLTGEGLGILPSDNIEMLRALGRDPLVIKATRIDAVFGLVNLMDKALSQVEGLRQSTLVMYGERDQIIPKEPVLKMLGSLPQDSPVRTAFYKHGYHLLLRDMEAEIAWRDIAIWTQDRRAPLPSGADRNIPQGFDHVLPVAAGLRRARTGGA